jgi:hypothetical protein
MVAACGGGDGMMTSSTMPTPASDPPMNSNPGNPMNPGPMGPMNPMGPMSVPGEAAVGAFLQTRHESLLHGADGAAAVVVSAPLAKRGSFNGVGPAYAATRTLRVRGPDQQLVTSATTRYFLANPYMPLGKAGADGKPFGAVTVSFGFPTTLRAGDSGPVDRLTYFHDAGMQVAEATEMTTYTVEARDAGSLRLCLRSTVSEVTPQGANDGLAPGTESECYAVTPDGTALLESVSTRSVTLR